MFERFDAWLIIGLIAWAVFCGLDAWIVSLYRKLKEQKGEINRLHQALNEAKQENTWLLARAEAKSEHRVLIRDHKIDRLREELDRAYSKIKDLEVMLEQKWKDAKSK